MIPATDTHAPTVREDSIPFTHLGAALERYNTLDRALEILAGLTDAARRGQMPRTVAEVDAARQLIHAIKAESLTDVADAAEALVGDRHV